VTARSHAETLTRRGLRAASLAWKVQRRLYHRTPVKVGVTARRDDFYHDIWREAAEATGGSLRELRGRLLEVRSGEVVMRVDGNLTSLDDALTLSMAEDKPLVYTLLEELDIPVARHAVVAADDLAAAWRFAAGLGGPCVVKPARGGSGAIGVTTGIRSRLDLLQALAYGGAFGRDVLVEEQVTGAVYRLLYLDGELLDAVRRDPPTVTGDGSATVERLIALENERRVAAGIEACQSLIKLDRELKHTLRGGGLGLWTVPAAGQTVLLKHVVNDNRREDNVSCAAELCDDLVATGAASAAAVGARLAGVDVMTTDVGRPLAETGGVVLEINAAPGYYYHYYKREGRVPVATLILEHLSGVAT
jgi:D-alanine-D-alanine ligase-like ATP-grasp enzyme